MNKSKLVTIQLVLLAIGSIAWWAQANELYKTDKFDKKPNVLHLEGSPFGRTLSLAMRGPIDSYLHRGEGHDHEGPCGPECGDLGHSSDCDEACDHEHGADCEEDCEHDHLADAHEGEDHICDHEDGEHEHTADCEHDHESGSAAAVAAKAPAEFTGIRPFLLDKISSMRTAYNTRTNRTVESPRHKAYIMGEMQRKLEISYRLDPSNLSAYGALHLFLSEALARVEGREDEAEVIMARRQKAHMLSHETLRYCWEHRDEAPAMITAATAAHDCLQILHDHPQRDMRLARHYLEMFDQSLHQYELLRAEMIKNGTWDQFPIARRIEMESAHGLVRNLNRADHETWGKLTGHTHPPAIQPGS